MDIPKEKEAWEQKKSKKGGDSARPIDADKIVYSWQVDADGQEHDGVTLQSIIDKMPTIEPERKKGKWQWLSSTYDRTPCEMRYMCSECHHETILHTNETSRPWEKFCPNCGAKMEVE